MPKPSRFAVCPHCGVRHHTITPEQCQDRSISEKVLTDRVLYRAKKWGWKATHAGRAIVGERDDGSPIFITPMAVGWPDQTLVKAGHRIIFMELKREQGEVTEEQWFWLKLLNLTGNHAIVVRPSDLRTGRVNAILRIGAPVGPGKPLQDLSKQGS
jgi:hypothetical protein